MADEKMNTGPEENPQPSLFDNGPEGAPAQDAPAPEPPVKENTPEQAAGEPLAQDAPAGAPGEVNVSADQIEKLMAERRPRPGRWGLSLTFNSAWPRARARPMNGGRKSTI